MLLESLKFFQCILPVKVSDVPQFLGYPGARSSSLVVQVEFFAALVFLLLLLWLFPPFSQTVFHLSLGNSFSLIYFVDSVFPSKFIKLRETHYFSRGYFDISWVRSGFWCREKDDAPPMTTHLLLKALWGRESRGGRRDRPFSLHLTNRECLIDIMKKVQGQLAHNWGSDS